MLKALPPSLLNQKSPRLKFRNQQNSLKKPNLNLNLKLKMPLENIAEEKEEKDGAVDGDGNMDLPKKKKKDLQGNGQVIRNRKS